MHAWLRNTVMRLRFIKLRSQVAAVKVGREEKAGVQCGARRAKRQNCSLFLFVAEFFRQDNSSFSFLTQRAKLGFQAISPDGHRRAARKRARFAMHQAHVSNVTMIHMRKEIRLVGAKRGKEYRYRNPGKNLRHARRNCLSANISTLFFRYFAIIVNCDTRDKS